MLTKSELRSKGIKPTRAQISERAIEIAKMIEVGSYKNAVACIGRMVALSKAIDDQYWDEKFRKGADMEKYFLLSNLEATHPDKNSMVD